MAGTRPFGICLSAVEFVHGERRNLAELEESTEVDVSTILRDVTTYRVTDRPVWQLAATAGAATLARAAGKPDLLIYVTENDRDATASLAMIATDLRLVDVEHIVVSGYHCGNLGPALRIARDALMAGRCERVLLLLADRSRPGERIMATGLSVLSDGAAACLVTRGPTEATGPQFTVDGTATVVDVDLDKGGGADRGILGTVALAASCIERLRAHTGHGPDDFRHLVLGNYRIASQQFMAAALGLKHKLLLGSVEDLGHCFSADLLVTLVQRRADGSLSLGDRVIGAATGPHSWSATSFRCYC